MNNLNLIVKYKKKCIKISDGGGKMPPSPLRQGLNLNKHIGYKSSFFPFFLYNLTKRQIFASYCFTFPSSSFYVKKIGLKLKLEGVKRVVTS